MQLEREVQLDSERVFRALVVFCRAGIPAFIWGPPGIGKSKMLRMLAAYFGAVYNDVRLLLREPTEIRISFEIDKRTGEAKLKKAWWIPDGKVPAIIAFDEFNAAPRTTQAAAYEPLLDHAIDGQPLPKNCYIVGAGNRESDRAVVEKMPTPARLRLAHLNMVTSIDAWSKWAAGSDQTIEQQEEFPVRSDTPHLMRPEVQAFNRFTGGRYLDQLGPADAQQRQALFNAQTFSSARGMEFLSKALDSGADKEDRMVEQACYAAVVGTPVASEFLTFMKVFKTLPDIDDIVARPDKAPVPKQDNVGTLYALSAALARRATKETFPNILKYLDRLPSVEFNVFCVRDALRRDISLTEVRDYAKWVHKHEDVGGW